MVSRSLDQAVIGDSGALAVSCVQCVLEEAGERAPVAR